MDLIQSRVLTTAVLATLAAMAAQPGPPQACVAWCEETDAPYLFVPGDVTTIDGWTSIAPTGGTPGRWLLGSDRISIAPIGGGADDWPRLIVGALAACSVAGVSVHMRAGTWLCQTFQSLPNDTGYRLIGAGIGKTVVASSLAAAGQNAPFSGVSVFAAAGIVAATPTQYSNIVTSTKSLNVGQFVLIQHSTVSAFQEAIYEAKTKAGGLTFTYNLDRVMLRPFAINDAFVPVTSVHRDGLISGMTVTGSGGVGGIRAFNMIGAVRCRIEDIRIDNSGGGAFTQAGSWEVGGVDNEISRVWIDAAGFTTVAYAFESNERLKADHCTVDRCTTGEGFYVIGTWDSDFISLKASKCVTGINFLGDVGDTIGCQGCRVIGGSFHGCSSNGVVLSAASCDITVMGCESYGAGGSNFSARGISGRFIGCVGRNAVSENFDVTAGATQTEIIDCRSYASGTIGLGLFDEASVRGFESYFDGTYSIYVAAATTGAIQIEHARITGALNGLYVNSANRVTLRDSTINTQAGANTSVNHQPVNGSVLVLVNVASTGGGPGSQGYSGGVGCTLRKYERVDFSSQVVPFTINAAGFVNSPTGNGAPEGTFALTGAVAVAYAFPDIKASDPVKLTLRVRAGVPAISPGFVITPGTGVAITGTAADVSVYDIEIG